MSSKRIGIVIALDGEDEFKQAALLKTEMKNLSKEFEGNANSMQALQSRQQALAQMQSAYQQKLEAANNGLRRARENYTRQTEKLSELNKQLEAAKDAQKQMEDAGDTSSKAYQSQCKEVEALTKAIQKQEVAQLRESGAITDWLKRESEARGQIREVNRALVQNEQYLNEARQASDHCATSIDNMGNAVEGAAGNFNESTEVVTSWSEKFKGAVARRYDRRNEGYARRNAGYARTYESHESGAG